jgi:hypothetical protein
VVGELVVGELVVGEEVVGELVVVGDLVGEMVVGEEVVGDVVAGEEVVGEFVVGECEVGEAVVVGPDVVGDAELLVGHGPSGTVLVVSVFSRQIQTNLRLQWLAHWHPVEGNLAEHGDRK